MSKPKIADLRPAPVTLKAGRRFSGVPAVARRISRSATDHIRGQNFSLKNLLQKKTISISFANVNELILPLSVTEVTKTSPSRNWTRTRAFRRFGTRYPSPKISAKARCVWFRPVPSPWP